MDREAADRHLACIVFLTDISRQTSRSFLAFFLEQHLSRFFIFVLYLPTSLLVDKATPPEILCLAVSSLRSYLRLLFLYKLLLFYTSIVFIKGWSSCVSLSLEESMNLWLARCLAPCHHGPMAVCRRCPRSIEASL